MKNFIAYTAVVALVLFGMLYTLHLVVGDTSEEISTIMWSLFGYSYGIAGIYTVHDHYKRN